MEGCRPRGRHPATLGCRRGRYRRRNRRDGQVIAYAPVAGTDWVVVKQVPAANAYALSNTVTERLLGLVAVAVIGFLALGGFVYRDPLGPVRDVTDEAGEGFGVVAGEIKNLAEEVDGD